MLLCTEQSSCGPVQGNQFDAKRRDRVKQKHFVDIMQKLFFNKPVEIARYLRILIKIRKEQISFTADTQHMLPCF